MAILVLDRTKRNLSALLIFVLIFYPGISQITDKSNSKLTITVNPKVTLYKMAGGIGASWHAISKDKIDESEEYKWALRFKNSRGSAWGGNPAVADTLVWDQIYRHAKWLGLDWIRVELSARMYEPEREKFDWNNEEMLALYKILDWAQENKADVFLQQMWSNVKWNSFPGVQPLLSAPKSIDDFANGLATLAEYLLVVKKYTCIKWLAITNEPPGGTWGSWWSKGTEDAQLTPALKAVREALDKKSILLPVSGPDWTDLPPFDAKKIDFDKYIGAYDIHSYQGVDTEKEDIIRKWAEWAKMHNKPIFLSEMGDMKLGWGDKNPGPKSFKAALSNAETILRGMDAGVSAFNRWSFTNRGDLDGQWQLIRTWDMDNRKYLRQVEIEPEAYYGFGIITRFIVKHSEIVSSKIEGGQEILSQTVKSPAGLLTTYILNKGDSIVNINLKIIGRADQDFYVYRVTESEITDPGYRMESIQHFTLPSSELMNITIPSKCICTISQYNLKYEDAGKIE
jgi:hypothetical protein